MAVYSWQVPPSWDDEHHLQISVAALHDGDRLQVTTERLPIWPFHHEELLADLAAADLTLEGSTYEAPRPEYLVTAWRAPPVPA